MSLEQVLVRLQGIRKAGANGSWAAICPAHADTNASLAVTAGDDGRVLLHCHAGCTFASIVEAAGIPKTELAPPNADTPKSRVVATYDYVDEQGTLLFQAVRFDPKKFRQRHRGPDGEWQWNLQGVRRVLYRLPEVMAVVSDGQQIYVVEGEKDADNGWRAGLPCTCNPMGAGKWVAEYSEALRGASVVILPDKDEPGRDHARKVVQSLLPVAREVRVMELPGSGVKDLSDWLVRGGTADELRSMTLTVMPYGETLEAAKESALAPRPLTDTLDAELSDLAAANRLIATHGDKIRYCPQLDHWFVWDSRRWRADDAGVVLRLAADCARRFSRSELENDDWKRVKAAMSFESINHCRGAVALAAVQEAVIVNATQLDQHRDLLCTPSGTVELRTGTLRPSRPEDLLTQMTAAIFDPAARCPRWMTFLDEIMCSDPERVEFLRRWFGYCATGETTEQALVVAHGSGRNGKGTLFDTVMQHVLGPDYGVYPAPKIIVAKDHEHHPTEFMVLRGARLACCSEVAKTASWDEATVKRLTGEDTITAHYMHHDDVSFQATHKLVVYLNEQPTVRDSTDAFWLRMHLLPFDATFQGVNMDKGLRAKLASEAPGILAWMVRGAADWYANGLPMPRAILDATNDYRSREDVVGLWLSDFCVDGPRDYQAKAAYQDFRAWAQAQGIGEGEIPGTKTFAQELVSHGCKRSHSKTGTRWTLVSNRKLTVVYNSDQVSPSSKCHQESSMKTTEASSGDTSFPKVVNPPCARTCKGETMDEVSQVSPVTGDHEPGEDDDYGLPF